ncbi:MAG: 6-bladed beta-propeller [bacterium]|nr:6-bladed beta-propeller [bacterium]
MNTLNKNKSLFLVLLAAVMMVCLSAYARPGKPESQEARISRWEMDLADDVLPEHAVKMQAEFSFPNDAQDGEEIVYVRQPAKMCMDKDGNIYVSDARNHELYKFGPRGKFIETIGRKGKGPGDLLNPGDIHFDAAGKLIIQDSSNSRIQTLSGNGEYISSFRVFEAYNSMILDGKGLIFCSPMGLNLPLVRIFNYSGKLVKSFGERVKFSKKLMGLNHVTLSMNNAGEIYAAWQFFPIVRKYSPEGKLLGEYKPANKKMKDNAAFNTNSIDGPAEGRMYKIVIQAIKARENGGFYLFQYYPRLEILEYDGNGKLQGRYWADQSYNYIANDFMVKEGPEVKTFYILQVFPESKIEVFTVPNREAL